MGDQPVAIESISNSLLAGDRSVVLLGATGTGKTFTMANVIQRLQRPTLILSHNKTLAAQLFSEMREFFPENAVEYFVSYYDYYQPEAYIPSTDTYIEKDSQINDEIDKLRHSATRSLLERNDVVIVSSISCIYGLGSPEAYEGMILYLEKGRPARRQEVLKKLIEIQYKRNDVDFHRGTFRVRGDIVDVFPAYEEERAIRIEFFGDEIEGIFEIDPLRSVVIAPLQRITIFPGSHYVTSAENRRSATESIRIELRERLTELKALSKLVEAQRLEQRTLFDLEMIEEMGFCQGIENYSRHLTGRNPGEAPPTLLEYFPKDWLLIVDESHVSVPQIGGMYRGDRARKSTLVEHGFRLPSALDNRPLSFEEWEKHLNQTVYVSATPGEYELQKTGGQVVEQVIRPTGLVDPVVEVRPATTQIDDLLSEIKLTVSKGFRVLVTTLTKRLAEDLTRYYVEKKIRVKYLHSDIETLERIEILRDLRLGQFDVLVGINLLREGLDLPEVALVAILDADKEGFLRSKRSLIQTIGRAARNVEGRAILYADRITDSMRAALEETERRRNIQIEYNTVNHIEPKTILKDIRARIAETSESTDDSYSETSRVAKRALGTGRQIGGPKMSLWASDQARDTDFLGQQPIEDVVKELLGDYFDGMKDWEKKQEFLQKDMKEAAKNLQFEKAADLRDRLRKLKKIQMVLLEGDGV